MNALADPIVYAGAVVGALAIIVGATIKVARWGRRVLAALVALAELPEAVGALIAGLAELRGQVAKLIGRVDALEAGGTHITAAPGDRVEATITSPPRNREDPPR